MSTSAPSTTRGRPILASPIDSVHELAIAWAAALNVAGREGETWYRRAAIIARVDTNMAAVGEVRGAAFFHVRMVEEHFERAFNIVHTRSICRLGVAPEFGCATLVST